VKLGATLVIGEDERDCTVRARAIPAVKGVRYTRNGDGWPDEPACAEDICVTEDKTGRDVTALVDKDTLERLAEDLLEQAEDDAYGAWEDALEQRADARSDR
jgi:hypothetical protein